MIEKTFSVIRLTLIDLLWRNDDVLIRHSQSIFQSRTTSASKTAH